MKKSCFFFLFCIIFFQSYSQTFEIKVVDSATETPIFEAHLTFGSAVFLTNKKGIAIVPNGVSKFLEISHIRYRTKKIKLENTKNKTVYLSENAQNLEEVTIISKINLKKEIHFTKLPQIPKSIHSFGSVLLDNKLYTFGGDGSDIIYSNRKGLSEMTQSDENQIIKFLAQNKPSNFFKYRKNVFVYDFNSKKWDISKTTPKPRAFHKAVLHENKVYLLGGKRLTKTKKKEMLMPQIEVLNLASDSIAVDEMNPHQGVNFESVVFDNKMLVIGGSLKLQENGLKTYSDKIHFYDFKTGYWYLLTTMKKGKETSGIIVNNKLFLFGGHRNKRLKEIESFNLVTGKWQIEGELFTAMEKPAIAKEKNTIYLFEKDRIVTYNTLTKELKEFRIDLPLYFSEIHIKNDKLYIVGGTKIKDYENRPQKSFVEIPLEEFENTRIRKSKTL
ncbi:MAG: hypothetical protein P8P00_02265 [Polaribacter sp.]|nr:hypothetical protein [Polaribacter sp.]